MRLPVSLAALIAFAAPALAAPLAVDVRNESVPVLCAEKDNVALSFPVRRCAAVPHRWHGIPLISTP